MTDKKEITCPECKAKGQDVAIDWVSATFATPEYQFAECLKCDHSWNECARD